LFNEKISEMNGKHESEAFFSPICQFFLKEDLWNSNKPLTSGSTQDVIPVVFFSFFRNYSWVAPENIDLLKDWSYVELLLDVNLESFMVEHNESFYFQECEPYSVCFLLSWILRPFCLIL